MSDKGINVGYMRVSKADGSQDVALQRDSLLEAGVSEQHLYEDHASGVKDGRPGLESCLRALRAGDVLVVWKLDRLGRSVSHLVEIVNDLNDRDVDLTILDGMGASIDTRTSIGRFFFQIMAAIAEYERELIRERTIAGLESARARGRVGGRRPKMTPAKVRLAQTAMSQAETVISDLCDELGVSRATLYRYVGPEGQLRERGEKMLAQANGDG